MDDEDDLVRDEKDHPVPAQKDHPVPQKSVPGKKNMIIIRFQQDLLDEVYI